MLNLFQMETLNSQKSGKAPLSSFLDFLFSLMIMVSIVSLIRFFVFQPYIVQGKSMEPTLSDGEYIIVDKFSYYFSKPKRGDIVILNPDLKMPDLSYIKRIVGLPGEKVIIEGGKVKIKTQKEEIPLDESYLPYDVKTSSGSSQSRIEIALGKDEYFVLGDNRNNSLDSRSIGPIKQNHIVGKARFVVLPIAKAGSIKEPTYFAIK